MALTTKPADPVSVTVSATSISTTTPEPSHTPSQTPSAELSVEVSSPPHVTSTPTGFQMPLVTPTLSNITNTPLSVSTTVENEPLFGIHLNRLSSETETSLLQEAGGTWSRFDDFKWEEIEPVLTDPPTFRWEMVDEEGLLNASVNEVQVIGIILITPEWARKYPGIACGPVAEDSLDRFGLFIKELVSRYGKPPFNVKYWEIGNEPDISYIYVTPDSGYGCWGEEGDEYYGGGYYAEMLKVVYPKIKDADPEAKVLVGGLLLDCDPNDPPETQPGSGESRDCSAARFLEGILENDGGDYFDGIGFHAYDYYFNALGNYGNGNWHSSWSSTGPVLRAKTAYIRDLLGQYGYSNKILVNSEVALLCGVTGNEDECKTDEFARSKMNYVAQSYAAAKAVGLDINIWYSLRGWRGSGLVNGNYDPYPAYNAYQFGVTQLEEASYTGDVSSYPGIMGYEFDRNGVRLWVIWALDDESHTIILPNPPNHVYDSLGNELPAVQTLQVTVEPLYIEMTP